MEQALSDQETLPLLRLPEELIVHIISQAIIQQVKESINNWNNIFNESQTIKVNLQDIKGFRDASVRLRNLTNDTLISQSVQGLIRDLKQKRFLKLFESLKNQSKIEYKDLSNYQLKQKLIKILDQNQNYIKI